MKTENGKEESLPARTRDGGPLSYQNWLAFKQGAPWRYVQEFPLFTDAHITGETVRGKNRGGSEADRRDLGPYAVLKTVADREHAETIVGAVLRMALHLDLSPRVEGSMERTEESAYHGGGMHDEIAALLSLCMGVRFRPGKCIRDFWPNHVDQMGSPRSIDLTDIPETKRRGKRMVVPSAAGPACLIRKTALLEKYVDMKPGDASVLVKVARSYQEAMWLAEIQPELSWLLFVQAVETAADHWMNDNATPLERVKDWGPGAKLLNYLQEQSLSSEQIESIAGIVGPYVGVLRKFREFLMSFLPPAYSSRPPAHTQVDWSDGGMRKVLKRVYECRCNAVHKGQPFPSMMCEAPRKLEGGYAERPVCSAAQVYGATWTGDDIPILLHTFEYIVRESLLKWWQSMLPPG